MVTSPRVLLPGFEYRRIDVEGVTINFAVQGSGPPLLMLHGYPQNHLAWRHVAPALAEDRAVVLADLRGYGDSGKPTPDGSTALRRRTTPKRRLLLVVRA
jgi:haloacetate dehalogenase